MITFHFLDYLLIGNLLVILSFIIAHLCTSTIAGPL